MVTSHIISIDRHHPAVFNTEKQTEKVASSKQKIAKAPNNRYQAHWVFFYKSHSQSGRATRWFSAPPSASTRLFPAAWQRDATDLATWLLPTNVRAFTPSESQRASAASRPPLTIWNTPGGTLIFATV